jgi:hypothetical protein
MFATVGWDKVTRNLLGLRKPDNHVFRIYRPMNEMPWPKAHQIPRFAGPTLKFVPPGITKLNLHRKGVRSLGERLAVRIDNAIRILARAQED